MAFGIFWASHWARVERLEARKACASGRSRASHAALLCEARAEGARWFGFDREENRVSVVANDDAASLLCPRVRVFSAARFTWKLETFGNLEEHGGSDVLRAACREKECESENLCLYAESDVMRENDREILIQAGFEPQARALDDEALAACGDDCGTEHLVYIKREHRVWYENHDSLSYLGSTSQGAHISLLVSDIRRSQHFYSLLGYRATHKFHSSGMARAAWLDSTLHTFPRLELIELSEHLRSSSVSVADAVSSSSELPLGLYHVSFDVTNLCVNLAAFLLNLDARSVKLFRKRICVLVPVRQQMMGHLVVEVAFIRDPDGTVLELIRRQTVLLHHMHLGIDF